MHGKPLQYYLLQRGFQRQSDCEQFQDAFCYVIAENLFVHSEKANCKIDTDYILLDIANVATAKQETKVPCKDVFAVPCNEIVDIPLSLPARNASAYVAAYLLRKYPMTNCQQCQNKCKLIKMPEINALYEFLKEKTYTEVSGLTYPTVCMILFVKELESLFSSTLEATAHMSLVNCHLCNSAQNISKGLSCSNEMYTENIQKMVKLYMRVKLFYNLKQFHGQSSTNNVKQNCKLLKLCHM